MYAAILNKKLVLAIKEAEQVNKGFKKLNQDYYTCPSCRKRMILILSEEKLKEQERKKNIINLSNFYVLH